MVASERLKNCIVNGNCTASSPPAKPTCRGSLTISSDSDCQKLYENYWSSITVNNDRCNSLTTGIVLQNNPCLTSISVGLYSLQNINYLTVHNNPVLNGFYTGDSYSLYYVEAVFSGIYWQVTII